METPTKEDLWWKYIRGIDFGIYTKPFGKQEILHGDPFFHDKEFTHKNNKSSKLSQDTPILPQVVKLGHAPNKIQVWKTTKGTNSKIKQARVMIPMHCTSPLWDLSTHEIS